MTTTFIELLTTQHELQRHMPPKERTPLDEDLTLEARIEFIHWNHTALLKELGEMLDEVGWKPWATSRFINEVDARGELVDAFHFFMNLLMATAPRGMDLEELARTFIEEYLAKVQVNIKRQVDGYDGVTAKCPSCHRDQGVARPVKVHWDDDFTEGVMCPCGYLWP